MCLAEWFFLESVNGPLFREDIGGLGVQYASFLLLSLPSVFSVCREEVLLIEKLKLAERNATYTQNHIKLSE
jgi:hypothetical protein